MTLVQALLSGEGIRVPTGSSGCFETRLEKLDMAEHLRAEIGPLLALLGPLNEQIERLDGHVGAIQTRVFKAPPHFAFLRNAVQAHLMAVRDVSRAKNRLRAVFRSRGVRVGGQVYAEAGRALWLKQLPVSHRPLAQWLGRQLDALEPLHESAEEWLLKEAKTHPIIPT